jgi:hypothetical protein
MRKSLIFKILTSTAHGILCQLYIVGECLPMAFVPHPILFL